METEHTAAFCRYHAIEMNKQADRAETAYLQVYYLSIAREWEQMAEQAETVVPFPRRLS